MFSYEFCEIFKNTFLYGAPSEAVSVSLFLKTTVVFDENEFLIIIYKIFQEYVK